MKIKDEEIEAFATFIDYLERPDVPNSLKIRRIRLEKGLSDGEQIVEYLEGLFSLCHECRADLIRYTLTEVLRLPAEDVRARMELLKGCDLVIADIFRNMAKGE